MHNFISHQLMKDLDFSVKDTPTYFMKVGDDGNKIQCQGIFKGLKLQLQGMENGDFFFLFELGGADVVLGLNLSASLGGQL